MKNDTERGTLGAWARKERLALGLSVEQVVARLSAIGATVDPAYLRAIESGSKRPRLDSEIVDALAAVYKSRPRGDEPAAPTSDMAALIGALTRQAEAMTALVQTVAQDAERANRMERQLSDLTDAMTRLADRMAAWEAGEAGPTGSPLGGREGGQRRGGGPKSHAEAP